MRVLIIFFLGIIQCAVVAQDCSDTMNTGEGTYYGGIDGTDGGNCSLPIALGDYFYCALNTKDYDGSAACGACIEVMGPKGKVSLRVVDRCPECKPGDVDMTEQAFGRIALVKNGRVPIRWRYVPCDTQNKTIKINFKTGSSRYWTAIQFRDLKYGIAMMEYKNKNNSWQKVPRALFNFFIAIEGITSPMELRITSVHGEQLIFDAVNLNLQSDYDTGVQLSTSSDCALSSATLRSENAKRMTPYPNPARDFFLIDAHEGMQYELYNPNGVLVKSGTLSNKNEPVSVGYLPRGLYYLMIENNGTPLVLQ